MRVVITGGTGFIGKALVSALIGKGHTVLCLGRQVIDDSRERVTHVAVNLLDPNSYIKVLADFGPEAACHLAWEGIPDFSLSRCTANLAMGVQFFDAVLALSCCQKVIGTGSCWEYGLTEGMCNEASIAQPNSHFTWAKDSIMRFGEMNAKLTSKTFGWFRVFFVYGPGQRTASLIPSIIAAENKNEVFKPKNPNAAQDFIYISDVVDAFVQAIETEWVSGVYNLGTGKLTSVSNVVHYVQDIVRDQTDQTFCSKVDSASGIWADTKKTLNQLKWQPKVSLAEGLRLTLTHGKRLVE